MSYNGIDTYYSRDMKKYHYTYLLIGLDHRLYIGVRSCSCLPEEDNYWGSFTDKTFKPISKHIQEIWPTRRKAAEHEIRLHNEFDVGANPLFANKCKHTSVGFDTTGFKHTPETKTKVGKASRGRIHTAQSRAKIAVASANRKHTLQTKIKISTAHKNKVLSAEHKIKLSLASARVDKQVYLWLNKKSNLVFSGTRCSFYKLFNLSKANVSKIVLGRLGSKTVKGWACIACNITSG